MYVKLLGDSKTHPDAVCRSKPWSFCNNNPQFLCELLQRGILV